MLVAAALVPTEAVSSNKRYLELTGNTMKIHLIMLIVFGIAFGNAEAQQAKPNIVYFLVDNLGNGELGCYGGGVLRGAETPSIDRFAREGILLLNFAPETQCTPSRSALMTGRYSIRSGNHTVALAGSDGGLVTWEKTLAEVLSDHGYATACVGKWHIGASKGRWPTDQGFDQWYGPAHSYDEALWADDPWYDPNRDPVANMYEARKGEEVKRTGQLTTAVKRDADLEYMNRSKRFIKESVDAGKPFFLYFNHTLMHLPTTPRKEFQGKSGHGERADCMMQLDHDFQTLLDFLKEQEVDGNTIVVFSGDNGPEHRGANGREQTREQTGKGANGDKGANGSKRGHSIIGKANVVQHITGIHCWWSCRLARNARPARFRSSSWRDEMRKSDRQPRHDTDAPQSPMNQPD